MRIIVRTQLHRAFPELDQYSDEQCWRFVAAARRGWRRRVLHWPLIALAGGISAIAAAIFGFAGVGLFTWLLAARHVHDGLFMAGWTVGMVAAALPLFCAVYLLRDWLLRRRIRYILRARGSCANCHYNLIGLPVSATHKVHCPECAMESTVDPALGELVTDQTGQPRYQPHESMIPRRQRMTAAQRKKLFRRTLACVTMLVLIIVAACGWYEWSIRAQAARALAAKPGAAGMIKFVETAQAADIAAGGENAWDVFLAATYSTSSVVAKFATEYKSELLDEAGDAMSVDISLLNGPVFEDNRMTDAEKRKRAKEIELARRLMDAYRQADVYDELDKLAGARWAVRPVNVAPNAPLITILLPELGQARQLARLNGARMYLAGEARDAREFGRALRSNLGLAGIIKRQPVLIDYLVGVAIEALCYARVEEVLANSPDAAMLDAIQQALDAQPADLPRSYAFNGERLWTLDSIAWSFSDPSRIRWGRFSPGLNSFASMFGGGLLVGRLGSYEENVHAANVMFDKFVAAAEQERWQRATIDNSPTGLVILDIMTAAIGNSLGSGDQIQLQRRGILTLIALQRHRLAHGDYPPSLSALVPSFIPALPFDPFSGKPLCYQRIDPATDTQKRSFLLYSVGRDGQDNGGKPALSPYEALHSAGAVGTDFILNDSRN